MAFIPIGRVINAISGIDWKGIGIVPDISVPQEQAFKVAYRLALETILAIHGDRYIGLRELYKHTDNTALLGSLLGVRRE